MCYTKNTVFIRNMGVIGTGTLVRYLSRISVTCPYDSLIYFFAKVQRFSETTKFFCFFSLLLNNYPIILRTLERRKASHSHPHIYTPTPIPTGLSSRIFSGNQTMRYYLCPAYNKFLIYY